MSIVRLVFRFCCEFSKNVKSCLIELWFLTKAKCKRTCLILYGILVVLPSKVYETTRNGNLLANIHLFQNEHLNKFNDQSWSCFDILTSQCTEDATVIFNITIGFRQFHLFTYHFELKFFFLALKSIIRPDFVLLLLRLLWTHLRQSFDNLFSGSKNIFSTTVKDRNRFTIGACITESLFDSLLSRPKDFFDFPFVQKNVLFAIGSTVTCKICKVQYLKLKIFC